MARPIVSPAESALRDLELLVRTTVEGLRQGLHRSPFHGFSAEFSQYRHYRPGDDLKYVDWKAFGRTDRLYTRQFRETTNMSAMFVVDISRSMGFPATHSKLDAARAAAGALATLVIDQGDAAGMLALGDATHYVPARSGTHHLHLLLATLARLEPAGAIPAAAALRRTAGLLQRRGLVVVLSDFYEEDDALGEVKRLARMGHEVIVVHVVSSEEIDLPDGGAAELVDLETGQRVLVDARTARDDYAAAMRAFLGRVQDEVTSQGLDYLRLLADEPIEPALRRFLIARRAGGQRRAG